MAVDRSIPNRPPHAGEPITAATLTAQPLSSRNARVAHLGRLVRQRRARDADGLFVVDGPVLLAEAVRDGVAVEDVFVAPGALDDPAVADAAAAAASTCARVWEVSGGLGPHVEVATPHGVVAVARRPEVVAPDPGGAPLHLVLVGVADPGNVGTLVRTAEAVGARSVVCADGTADPWSPKVVRASAGSVWRQDVSHGRAEAVLDALAEAGVRRIGTAGAGGLRAAEVDMAGPTALVLGSEAHGLPAELALRVDAWVSLPMQGVVESLNVAVAGSVLAFEAVRQREAAAGTGRGDATGSTP